MENDSSNDGGAIDVWPYSGSTTNNNQIFTSVGTVKLDNCSFAGNQAWRYGGAVNLFAVFGKVEITNSAFTGNKTLTTASTRYGGAVACQGLFNELQIVGNTFTDCQSVNSSGGAIGVGATVGKLTIESSDFRNCSAVKGGAVSISTVSLNKIHFAPLGEMGSNAYSRINTLEILGCSFTDCTSSSSGGGVLLESQVGQVVIGTAAAPNTFTNCSAGNESSGGGIRFGSITLSSDPQWTPAQWIQEGMTIEIYAGGEPYDYFGTRSSSKYTAYKDVIVENTTFEGCVSNYGGGLYVANNASMKTLTFKDVTVKNCQASAYESESGSSTGGTGGGIGLASYEPGTAITLTNVKTFNNQAWRYGGGIYVNARGATTVTVSGGEYYGNTSENGGGIYINGDTDPGFCLTVSDTKVYNNTTTRSGGGIYLSDRSANNSFTNVHIYGNMAGARKDSSGNVTESGTENCRGDGGGVYIVGTNTTEATFGNCIIGAKLEGSTQVAAPNKAFDYRKAELETPATDNEPAQYELVNQGGGIVIFSADATGPRLVLNETQVLNNEAAYYGGGIAICCYGGTLQWRQPPA